jgi:hypothetical protein
MHVGRVEWERWTRQPLYVKRFQTLCRPFREAKPPLCYRMTIQVKKPTRIGYYTRQWLFGRTDAVFVCRQWYATRSIVSGLLFCRPVVDNVEFRFRTVISRHFDNHVERIECDRDCIAMRATDFRREMILEFRPAIAEQPFPGSEIITSADLVHQVALGFQFGQLDCLQKLAMPALRIFFALFLPPINRNPVHTA